MKEIINKNFSTDIYQSNGDKPKSAIGRWYKIKSRWFFVLGYMKILFANRKKAVKGIYNRKEWALSSIDVIRHLEECGGKFHITGLDVLRNLNEPVVFISNHMSTLETMVFPGIIAPFMRVTFVVKDTLESHPLFGPVMRARKPIVVSRANSREDLMNVMKKGKDILLDGKSVVIFPQSKRKVEFVPSEFNSLGVKLAGSAGVKVVPVAIKTDFWGNGKYLKELGKIDRNKTIYIHFGEAMEVSRSGKEEHKQIVEFIQNNIEVWSDAQKN